MNINGKWSYTDISSTKYKTYRQHSLNIKWKLHTVYRFHLSTYLFDKYKVDTTNYIQFCKTKKHNYVIFEHFRPSLLEGGSDTSSLWHWRGYKYEWLNCTYNVQTKYSGPFCMFYYRLYHFFYFPVWSEYQKLYKENLVTILFFFYYLISL